MAGQPSLDAEVGEVSSAVLFVNERLEPSLAFLDLFAKSESFPQGVDFDAENQRIQEMTSGHARVDEIVADRLEGFAKRTDRLYEKFEIMNDYTRFEAFIAVFSKASAQRRRAARISRLALIQTLKNMLLETDPLFALLSRQRAMATKAQTSAEANVLQIIERRKSTTTLVENTHRRSKELNAQLAILQRKIAATADETVRAETEAYCVPLAAELQDSDAREQLACGDLDVLERHITMFETFVQALNDLAAGHTIFINKLIVETERCILLLDALGSLPPASSASGNRPDQTADEFAIVEELLELHRHHDVSLGDLARRKKRIDDAFVHRFRFAA